MQVLYIFSIHWINSIILMTLILNFANLQFVKCGNVFSKIGHKNQRAFLSNILIRGGSASRYYQTTQLKLNSESSSNTEILVSVNKQTIDYVNSSTRFLKYFRSSSENLDNSISITIVSKSNFNSWKELIDKKILKLFEAISGDSLEKFPGTKLIILPEENGSDINDIKPTYYLLYDDTASKIHFKTFESIWNPIWTRNSSYHLNVFGKNQHDEIDQTLASSITTSWALSTHKFNFLKTIGIKSSNSTLAWTSQKVQEITSNIALGYTVMKDLGDSPALQLGPRELLQSSIDLLQKVSENSQGVLRIDSTIGVNELMRKNFPQIAAVGMAASVGREPCLLDATWIPQSEEQDSNSLPEICIIGKGVVFDTGGLNMKPGASMRHMKKDMSGAAQALALALMLINSQLPIKLRLILPIVENSISGIALRPGDVITARNGKTTEITNTDAEGRLILADSLVLACESSPSIILDMATLTGAARVALGTDLPALFSNNQDELEKFWKLSSEVNDAVWLMPLFEPLRSSLKSNIADLINAAEGGYGGAITAALYLSEFISTDTTNSSSDEKSSNTNSDTDIKDENKKKAAPLWFHIDFMGSKSNYAEPQGMMACFEYLTRRFKSQ